MAAQDFAQQICTAAGQPEKDHFLQRKTKMTYETICVPRLCFQAVRKETGTRGHLYVVWHSFREAFVAQTVPPLIKLVTKLTHLKLSSSSFYRILRSEAKKPSSKGFHIKRLPSVQELNEFLQGFELLIICSMDLDKWEIEPDTIQEERNGSSSPQRTEIQL